MSIRMSWVEIVTFPQILGILTKEHVHVLFPFYVLCYMWYDRYCDVENVEDKMGCQFWFSDTKFSDHHWAIISIKNQPSLWVFDSELKSTKYDQCFPQILYGTIYGTITCHWTNYTVAICYSLLGLINIRCVCPYFQALRCMLYALWKRTDSLWQLLTFW